MELFLFNFSYHVRRASNFHVMHHCWDKKKNFVIVPWIKPNEIKTFKRNSKLFSRFCSECKEKGLPVMKINSFKWEPSCIINILHTHIYIYIYIYIYISLNILILSLFVYSIRWKMLISYVYPLYLKGIPYSPGLVLKWLKQCKRMHCLFNSHYSVIVM